MGGREGGREGNHFRRRRKDLELIAHIMEVCNRLYIHVNLNSIAHCSMGGKECSPVPRLPLLFWE